ncbi:transmembrane protein, putative (macronuclear) [Tetrahymena thermophila SB210]|uniref:Transmembrane protein, putative n=1 Tax=Tetrahymena thermophila (strain SB210) TaxID=312017 RepID=Q23Q74_TETTS|nr:transmembrane protein, putative [Tetrahymena thermophila SB210]EAR98710.2 transmembrane protein, putative [Tetrahymena thermophila SB210]|eukprot:XP_001018955.2 transmembrane protein, putative [Tetrahymena thermophila SB210]
MYLIFKKPKYCFYLFQLLFLQSLFEQVLKLFKQRIQINKINQFSKFFSTFIVFCYLFKKLICFLFFDNLSKLRINLQRQTQVKRIYFKKLMSSQINAKFTCLVDFLSQEKYDQSQIQLKLSNSLFDKNNSEQFIQELKKYSQLTKLALRLVLNQLSSDIGSILGNGFSQMSNLQSLELILDQCEYDDNINIIGLLNLLTSCIKLKYLNIQLNENKLNNQRLQNITQNIQKCKDLTDLSLNLSECWIDDDGVQILSGIITEFQYLININLNLSCNFIGAKGVIDLGKQLSQVVNLKKLQLSMNYNHFRNAGIANLIEEISQCRSLQYLDLQLEKNKLSSQYFSELSIQFLKFVNLSTLKLSFIQNYIQDEGLIEFGRNLKRIKCLKRFIINIEENNQISYEAIFLFYQRIIKIRMLVEHFINF